MSVFPAAELNKRCDFTYVRALTRKSAERRSLFSLLLLTGRLKVWSDGGRIERKMSRREEEGTHDDSDAGSAAGPDSSSSALPR